MTTVAYKDGIVAYDSMITNGDSISSLKFDKHRTDKEGNHYFLAGVVSDYEKFINRESNVDCSAIVVYKNGEVKEIHCTEEGDYFEMIPSNQYSIGTGELVAMGAMDAGCSAKKALKIAKSRDIYTGGKIRTFKVDME